MSASDSQERLRRLPSVDALLRSETGRSLLARHPRWAVVRASRDEIEAHREALSALPADVHLDGGDLPGTTISSASTEDGVTSLRAIEDGLTNRVADLLRPSLRPVLNATGVVLHTNLGRAPLSNRALARIEEVARGYCTLEFDPTHRERGSRHDHVREHLLALTGAEAAVVVNNNAAAVWLALAALGNGRDVIVSRGELVEIGGGFRIPDVMQASGARIVEVGTTNRTRLDDYLDAVGPDTALFLKVHRSNFAMVGFTEDTSSEALATAGRARGIPLMIDLGSGAIFDLAAHGLPAEPTVTTAIQEGADVVTFSGDKLLGGPQAGIIVGREAPIARIARHPLMRALRPDKLTLAALEATLESYRAGTAREELPVLAMLTAPIAILAERANRLMEALRPHAPSLTIEIKSVRSAVGGGALPLAELETRAVVIRHRQHRVEAFAQKLADGTPPLIARIHDDAVILDVRSLADSDLPAAASAVAAAANR